MLLAKISLQGRQKKLSIVCTRIHQYSSPQASHQSRVPFQRQSDAIKTSLDIMSIARSFAEMKDVLWVSNSMWYTIYMHI